MPFLSNDLLVALPRLRRYARVLTGDVDLADEMVKDTLTRARQIEYESPSQAAAAVRLFSMLRFVYADEFAPGRPRGPMLALHTRELSPLAGADSTGDTSESNAPRTNELLAQLLQLPLEDREVLVLVAVERMSYEDIATLLAVPVATVLARLTQARESLRSEGVEALRAPKSTR